MLSSEVRTSDRAQSLSCRFSQWSHQVLTVKGFGLGILGLGTTTPRASAASGFGLSGESSLEQRTSRGGQPNSVPVRSGSQDIAGGRSFCFVASYSSSFLDLLCRSAKRSRSVKVIFTLVRRRRKSPAPVAEDDVP